MVNDLPDCPCELCSWGYCHKRSAGDCEVYCVMAGDRWPRIFTDPPEDPDDDLDSLSGYPPDTGRYRLKTSVVYAGDYNDIRPFQCKGSLQDTTGHFSLHEFNVWASTEADAHEKGIECAQRIIKANRLTEAGATVKITYFD